MRRWIGMGAGTAVVALAVGMLASSGAQAGDDGELTAVLRDADGSKVGTVHFDLLGGETWISADIVGSDRLRAGFHGFHIHTNDVADNGSGCAADPTQAPSTWFTAVDGHLGASSDDHGAHGMHPGDMPNVLTHDDGTGRLQFVTGRVDFKSLIGRAIVLHALPDNYGNIPLGTAADQYTSNGSDAGTKTAKTGNAGDRIACGVIVESPDE